MHAPRFTALHLALVAILTLLIVIALFGSLPTPALDTATASAITNLVPKTATASVDILPTLPVYLRGGTEGLIPEAESELELTLQWTVIDHETEALIPQAVTSIQVVTLEGIKEELTIEGAELEFTVPVGAVVRWKVRAEGYVEERQWREFKAKLNRSSTMKGGIRLVPLKEQA